MESNKILFGILAVLAVAFIAIAVFYQESGAQKEKLFIASTFYPINEIAREIAGENAETFAVIPQNVEPHDFDPDFSTIKKFGKANIFVTLGIEFEEIENKLLQSSEKEVIAIDAKKGMDLIEHDPHVWISPKRMKIIAFNINEGLKKSDEKNAKSYQENYENLMKKLNALDNSYSEGLKNCKKNIILTNHQAFAYLALDYGFEQKSISGVIPESEPSPAELQKLVEIAKENGIKYVFFEELQSPKVAETIAREANIQTLELNPLEGTKGDATIFDLMERNLNNLRIGLECE